MANCIKEINGVTFDGTTYNTRNGIATNTIKNINGVNTIVDEAATIIAAFTTPPTAARSQLISDVVNKLKNNGLWTKIGLLYVFAAADTQAARVNWMVPSQALATTGGTAPTHTADRGYVGNGTNGYVMAGVTEPNITNGYTRNSCNAGVFNRTNATENGGEMGATSGSQVLIRCKGTSNASLARIQQTTNISTTSATNAQGLFCVNRSGASATEFYRNGTNISSGTVASLAIVVANKISWCGSLSQGVWSAHSICAGVASVSLTSTEQNNLYLALNTYMTSVGAI